MTPQLVDTVVYNVKASTNHNLVARGQTIRFDGWAKVYKYSKTKEEILPVAEDKEDLTLKSMNKTKHTTQPPARYNEGSLAKMMEKEGVGRPATRAGIITSIQKKNYVGKEPGKGKGLVASDLGMRICDYLQPNFKDFFMDIKYTAKLEEELDEIAQGKKTYLDVVKTVYELLQKYIKDAEGNEKTKPKEAKLMGTKCTVCGEGEIVEKSGQYGIFYSCDKYPACKTAYNRDEAGNFTVKVKKEVKTTGRKCPECQKAGRNGEMLERTNKSNGDKFFGCSKYPACKHSEQLDGTTSKKKDFSKKFSKPKKEIQEPDSDVASDNAGLSDDDLGFN
jgi:DNA topoisomerase-1